MRFILTTLLFLTSVFADSRECETHDISDLATFSFSAWKAFQGSTEFVVNLPPLGSTIRVSEYSPSTVEVKSKLMSTVDIELSDSETSKLQLLSLNARKLPIGNDDYTSVDGALWQFKIDSGYRFELVVRNPGIDTTKRGLSNLRELRDLLSSIYSAHKDSINKKTK